MYGHHIVLDKALLPAICECQYEALRGLYSLEKAILSASRGRGNLKFKTKNWKLLEDWRLLQTSDHFYYMCTKWFADGDVHKYFSPYGSPYEAFIAFMNVLQDIKLRLASVQAFQIFSETLSTMTPRIFNAAAMTGHA